MCNECPLPLHVWVSRVLIRKDWRGMIIREVIGLILGNLHKETHVCLC